AAQYRGGRTSCCASTSVRGRASQTIRECAASRRVRHARERQSRQWREGGQRRSLEEAASAWSSAEKGRINGTRTLCGFGVVIRRPGRPCILAAVTSEIYAAMPAGSTCCSAAHAGGSKALALLFSRARMR